MPLLDPPLCISTSKPSRQRYHCTKAPVLISVSRSSGSIHYDDGVGGVHHFEFLADGHVDPRREFAEALLQAIDCTSGPIIVYSPFEAGVLHDLAAFLPDLSGPLRKVINRICDLLPIVRAHVAHPSFLGSYSIKTVAPALLPTFSYDDLGKVTDGIDASAAFYRLAADRSLPDGDQVCWRNELLAYCGRDTLAMLHVHRRLLGTD